MGILWKVSFLLPAFIYVGIEEAAAFWTTTYFHDTFGPGDLGEYALSGYWGGMIVGRYIGSRFEGKVFLFGGLLIFLASLLGALLIMNGILNFVCFIMLGFGLFVIWPLLMSATAKRYPEHTGTAFGIMMAFSVAGGVLLPFLTDTIESVRGIGITFWVIPVMVLMLILMQTLLQDFQRRTKNNEV